MTTKKNIWTILTAAVVGGALLTAAAPAMAGGPGHDGHGRPEHHDDYRMRRDDHRSSGLRVGIIVDQPVPVYTPAPGAVVTQQWVPGGYVTQTQNVLVQPAHWEMRTIPAVTETRYPSNGAPAYTVIVAPAHTENVWVADRYEAQAVQVWVPGHWETVAIPVQTCVPAPAPAPRATISIGGIIRF